MLICMHAVLLFQLVGTRSQAAWAAEHQTGCTIALSTHERYPAGTIAQTNCGFDSERGRPTDEAHCPRAVPLALVLVPKCASTSFFNWLVEMDGMENIYIETAHKYEAIMQKECLFTDGCGKLGHEAFVSSMKSLAHVTEGVPLWGSDADWNTLEGQEEIFFRFFRRAHEGLMPFPAACTPCCRGDKRLRVVVTRNPFSRLMAYFQRGWVGNKEKSISLQEDFHKWCEALGMLNDLGAYDETLRAGAAASVLVGNREVVFSAEDLYHTQSTSKLLSVIFPDFRLDDAGVDSVPSQAWLLSRMFVVRMETAQLDLNLLGYRLCMEYGNCQPLPDLDSLHMNVRSPDQLKDARMFWRSPSGAEAARTLQKTYTEDFRIGSYSHDPEDLIPNRPSTFEVEDFAMTLLR